MEASEGRICALVDLLEESVTPAASLSMRGTVLQTHGLFVTAAGPCLWG